MYDNRIDACMTTGKTQKTKQIGNTYASWVHILCRLIKHSKKYCIHARQCGYREE